MNETKSYIIKKAKLINGDELHVEYEQITGSDDPNAPTTTSKHTAEGGKPLHPDLIAAFYRLKPHLPIMCEITKDGLLPVEDDELSQYAVTGYSIGGSDEHEGVTLVGRKRLRNRKVLNLVTPFTKWDDEHAPYMYSTALKIAIADVESEIIEYLFNGKYGQEAQPELDFSGKEEETNA